MVKNACDGALLLFYFGGYHSVAGYQQHSLQSLTDFFHYRCTILLLNLTLSLAGAFHVLK